MQLVFAEVIRPEPIGSGGVKKGNLSDRELISQLRKKKTLTTCFASSENTISHSATNFLGQSSD